MTLFVCSPVDTDSFILRHLAWSLQLRYWRLHLAWSLQLYCLQLTIFSLLCSAYYVQLTIFNLLSSALLSLAYRLQLTLFSLLSSAYCLQLTIFSFTFFSLLSSAYSLQLTMPKMQSPGMGWSCRLYNKVVSHEWSWQPCYVRRLLFRHGLITKLPLSAAPYSIVSSALADGLWS